MCMINRRRLASDVTIGRTVKGLTAQATATGENWLIFKLHVRQTILAVGFLATPTRTTRAIAKGTCSAIRVMFRLKIMSLIGASTRHQYIQWLVGTRTGAQLLSAFPIVQRRVRNLHRRKHKSNLRREDIRRPSRWVQLVAILLELAHRQ